MIGLGNIEICQITSTGHIKLGNITEKHHGNETKTGLSHNIYRVIDADNMSIINASMAQLVEQLAFNQWGDVSPLKVRTLLGAPIKF